MDVSLGKFVYIHWFKIGGSIIIKTIPLIANPFELLKPLPHRYSKYAIDQKSTVHQTASVRIIQDLDIHHVV